MGACETITNDAASEKSGRDSISRGGSSTLQDFDPVELEVFMAASSVLKCARAESEFEKHLSITNKGARAVAIRIHSSRFRLKQACYDTDAFLQAIQNGTVSTDPKYACTMAVDTILKPLSKVLSPFWKWKDSSFREIAPGETLAFIGGFTKLSSMDKTSPIWDNIMAIDESVAPELKAHRRTLVHMKEYPVNFCLDFSIEDWKAGRLDLDTLNITQDGKLS